MTPDPVPAAELAGLARNDPLTRPRPGHADLAGMQKYGHDDARPVLERASARETAARVAIGEVRSEEHTSELQSPDHLVCRLLLEKKKTKLTLREREHTAWSRTNTATARSDD